MSSSRNSGQKMWFNYEAAEMRIYNWTILKVGVPLLVLFFILPVYAYSLKLDHPFPKAFAHGDLLIFSALILIEAAFELETADLRERGLHVVRLFAIALAVVSVFWFGIVKFDVMRPQDSPDFDKMHVYACLSWCIAVLAGLSSVYAIMYAHYREEAERLSHMAQD